MACACRTASWRSFVSGLAQVHRLELSSTAIASGPRLPLPQSSLSRSFAQTQAARCARSLHGSALLRQEASTQAASPESADSLSHETTASDSDGKAPSMAAEVANILPGHTETLRKRGPRAMNNLTDAPKPANKRGPKPKASFDNERVAPRERPTVEVAARAERPHLNKGGASITSRVEAAQAARSADEAQPPRPNKEYWQLQKQALKEKFPEGWRPKKRLSPDALAGIRALNAQFPEVYTTQALADKFAMSPESIRRILRSKWTPSVAEEEDRNDRWHRRGKQIWETRAALGVKPPRKWREEGIARDPGYHADRERRIRREQEWEEEERRKYSEYRASLQRAADKVV